MNKKPFFENPIVLLLSIFTLLMPAISSAQKTVGKLHAPSSP